MLTSAVDDNTESEEDEIPEIPQLDTDELSLNTTEDSDDEDDDEAKTIADMWETMKIFLAEFKNLTAEVNNHTATNSTEETIEKPLKRKNKKKKTVLPIDPPEVPAAPGNETVPTVLIPPIENGTVPVANTTEVVAPPALTNATEVVPPAIVNATEIVQATNTSTIVWKIAFVDFSIANRIKW